MRNLKTRDLFSLSRIVKKMNIKEDIKALTKDITGLSDKEKKKAQQGLNIELTLLFVEHFGDAEKEVCTLLGSLTDKTSEEIEELELEPLIEIVTELFKQESLEKLFTTALK
jgi:hypothetical protein